LENTLTTREITKPSTIATKPKRAASQASLEPTGESVPNTWYTIKHG